MNWHVIFYDFKRSFLKPSVLAGILLITFLGLGILLLFVNILSSTISSPSARQVIIPAFLEFLLIGLSVFSFFFPFIIIYLTFVTFVRPRNEGSLQFILVKPITRTQLVITRYISGALIIIISTILFTLLSAFIVEEIGHIKANLFALMLAIIGIIISQLSFYSLTYLLGSSIRSTSAYLGISVGVYIILLVTSGVLGLFSPTADKIYSYINPLSLSSLIMYPVNPILGFKPNIYIVIISSIIWITVPIYLSSRIYERTDYP